MSGFQLVGYAGTVISAALAWFSLYKFVKYVSRNRVVADTSLVRIRSAAQGYVKVAGRVKAATEAFAAPLSGRPCVWWSYEVQEKKDDNDGGYSWSSVDRASSITPFILADDDGECLVGPVNAEITPTVREVWYGHGPRPRGGATVLGISAEAASYRYTEHRLCVDEQVSVVGELRSYSEARSSAEHSSQLLREWKRNQAVLLQRFDTNKDGRIDATEWERARAAAERAILEMPIERMNVICEPTDNKPFIIASLDSAELVRREKLNAMFYLCSGLACSVICASSLAML